jgi:AcrR family transcriptional regulator
MPRAGLDADTVVAAAARLADAEGLQVLTLARLAADLGVRSPSLYAHVGGLEDVRRRLAVRGSRELAVELSRAAAGRAGTEALVAIADAYRRYASSHPGSYEALQHAPDPDDAEAVEAATAAIDVVLAALRGYGVEGDEAIHAARIIRSALHGFVTLQSGGGFGIPLALDETFARLVRTLDVGLRAGLVS